MSIPPGRSHQAEHLATRICNRDGQCEGRPNRPSEPQELKASEGIVGLAFRNQGPEFELLPEDDFPGPEDVLYLRRVLHDEWIGCVATWQQADLDAARAEAKEIYAELFE